MVAYSFKQQFVAPILSGTKRQTIRAPRRGRSRHALPGDDFQLYTAMRTKYCTLIGRAICIAADEIRLDLDCSMASIEQDNGVSTIYPHGMEEFARCDGFADWAEMRAFWTKEHPGQHIFRGVLIRWGAFRPA